MKKFIQKRTAGFTLIEMLVVIGIIAILAAVVLVAVNPTRQFANARNSQRRSDIYAITNAVYQYAIENNGTLPSVITSTPTNMGTNAGLVDLTATLTPVYIAAIPADPQGTDADTLYEISQTAEGRIVVTATGAELGAVITVNR